MTVKQLRCHFPADVKFVYYGSNGEKQANAMSSDKIKNWVVTTDFEVVVVLR